MTKTILSIIPKAALTFGLTLPFAYGMEMELDNVSNTPYFPSLEMDLEGHSFDPFGYSEKEVKGNTFSLLSQDFVDLHHNPYGYSESPNYHTPVYTGFNQAPVLTAVDQSQSQIKESSQYSAGWLLNVTTLDLSSDNPMSLDILAHTPNLTSLNLSNRGINDKDMKTISALNSLKNIQVLNLSKNFISNQGIQYLSKSKTLNNLKSLDLSYNSFGNRGAQDIASSSKFNYLTNLNLSGNTFSTYEHNILQERFPLANMG